MNFKNFGGFSLIELIISISISSIIVGVLFSILTNIVPKGIIQSETKSFKPIKTEMIPKTKPISNPKIIFECNAIT